MSCIYRDFPFAQMSSCHYTQHFSEMYIWSFCSCILWQYKLDLVLWFYLTLNVLWSSYSCSFLYFSLAIHIFNFQTPPPLKFFIFVGFIWTGTSQKVQEELKLNTNMNCKGGNLIYCLTCPECVEYYIGEKKTRTYPTV